MHRVLLTASIGALCGVTAACDQPAHAAKPPAPVYGYVAEAPVSENGTCVLRYRFSADDKQPAIVQIYVPPTGDDPPIAKKWRSARVLLCGKLKQGDRFVLSQMGVGPLD